jgi:hypothetical protein
MLCAEQHQIVHISGERRRSNRIAARPVCTVGDDMRDETELSILTASDQITDKVLVASAVLAPPSGLGPEGDLNFAWDLCLSFPRRSPVSRHLTQRLPVTPRPRS